MAKYDLIETKVMDDGAIFKQYFELPSKSLEERQAFAQQHDDLMRRWDAFKGIRDRVFWRLKGEEDYVDSIKRSEALHGETRYSDSHRLMIENGEQFLEILGNHYEKLQDFSWIISQTYGHCDAEAMREALDEAEQVIKEAGL